MHRWGRQHQSGAREAARAGLLPSPIVPLISCGWLCLGFFVCRANLRSFRLSPSDPKLPPTRFRCVCSRFACTLPARQNDTKKDRDDIALVERTLMKLARELGYRVVMSLANSKKAGSAALIK